MCLYPRLILNRRYTKTKKNGGNIPPVNDPRVLWVPIGCQNCIECKKQKARAWQSRLLEDIKTNTNGKFVCFTFSNEAIAQLHEEIPKFKIAKQGLGHKILQPIEGYAKDNQIAILATRRFLERYRKKYKTSVRHWLVTELGHKGTENIHLHGIIWTNKLMTEIEKIWTYGFIWKGQIKNGQLINYVNASTVNYTVKYVHKIDHQHKTYTPIILTSPGIGANYTKTLNSKLNNFKNTETQETYLTNTGHKIALPIYWRNKIYTDTQKEQLWINKLNKQERWICGEKIDISKTEEEYYKLLEYHRIRNKELGYGDHKKNWDRIHYEKIRRELIIKKRIETAKK